jgi:hypothetical protein
MAAGALSPPPQQQQKQQQQQQQQQQPERPCHVCDVARDLWAMATGSGAAPGATVLEAPTGIDMPLPRDAAAAPLAGTGEGSDAPGRRADCLGCRLTGLMAGLGAAGYLSSRLLEEPPPRGGHRAALLASSAALAALGLARGFGWY